MKNIGRDLDLLTHEHFMREAQQEARKAFKLGEVPVGAILVLSESI